MAKRHKLRDFQAEHGAELENIIPPLVNFGGQKHAAHILGVSAATISRWLKDNGYIPKVSYVKERVAC